MLRRGLNFSEQNNDTTIFECPQRCTQYRISHTKVILLHDLILASSCMCKLISKIMLVLRNMRGQENLYVGLDRSVKCIL